MKKILTPQDKLKEKNQIFFKNINSEMYFESNVDSDSMSLSWLDEVEFACPYIDNIIKNPRMALITEEDVVKIEKAKKITVASVKNLSKNTHYIDKITEAQEVQPSKILIERREETYNTYENRFIFTLIDNLIRFVMDKERILENLDTKSSKKLEYYSSTLTDDEKLNIEVTIKSAELPKNKTEDDFKKELEEIKRRVKFIKDYISDWRRSEFITSLEKANVAHVIPPIRKTNMILKNPNFQIASKLWQYLLNQEREEESAKKEGLESRGDESITGLLDDTFATYYFMMDSVKKLKKDQNEKLRDYALIMITNYVRRIIELLLNLGYDIKEDEILKLIAEEIKDEKTKKTAGVREIEKKFKDAINEFLKESKEGMK